MRFNLRTGVIQGPPLQERKLRERSEEYCRQLQMEARSRTTSDLGSSSSLGVSSDASRLELERMEVSVVAFPSLVRL